MIKNVPSATELEEISLRLFFSAWRSLIEVNFDKDEIYTGFSEDGEEIDEYITLAQPDLHLIYTIMQQSQEIGIKSILCSASPYLLLLGSNVRDWAKENGDFSTFRTIDASDLIRVVNIIFPGRLSNKYRQQYEEIRGNRNKIQHLGSYKNKLDPAVLMDMMIVQYQELFPERKWLPDRLDFQSKTRLSTAYTKNWNEYHTVMDELSKIEHSLTGTQFKTIFGISKKKRRYLCPHCLYETRGMLDTEATKTAVLNESGDHAVCQLCQSETPVKRVICKNKECKSDVVCANPEYGLECLICQHEFSDEP